MRLLFIFTVLSVLAVSCGTESNETESNETELVIDKNGIEYQYVEGRKSKICTYKGKPLNGTIVSNYDDGTRSWEERFEDGLLVFRRSWYCKRNGLGICESQGHIRQEVELMGRTDSGKWYHHGELLIYDEDGVLIRKAVYKENEMISNDIY